MFSATSVVNADGQYEQMQSMYLANSLRRARCLLDPPFVLLRGRQRTNSRNNMFCRNHLLVLGIQVCALCFHNLFP